MFREDVKVTIATSGLYEWLLKVVSVSGVIGGGDEGEGTDAHGHASQGKKKGDNDEKQMLGVYCTTSRIKTCSFN